MSISPPLADSRRTLLAKKAESVDVCQHLDLGYFRVGLVVVGHGDRVVRLLGNSRRDFFRHSLANASFALPRDVAERRIERREDRIKYGLHPRDEYFAGETARQADFVGLRDQCLVFSALAQAEGRGLGQRSILGDGV